MPHRSGTVKPDIHKHEHKKNAEKQPFMPSGIDCRRQWRRNIYIGKACLTKTDAGQFTARRAKGSADPGVGNPQHRQAFAAAEKDVAGASPVTSAFVNLLNGLWSKEVAGSGLCDTRTLQDFKTVIGKFATQFAGYNQQDVSEFLAFLIDDFFWIELCFCLLIRSLVDCLNLN